MSTESNNNNEDQPSYPLFNLEALKKISNQTLPPNMISPSSIAILTDRAFLKKMPTFDQNIEIVTRKRGRKPKKEPTKDINAMDITIKEIIEDQQSGIPTADEIKKKEEKIRKMREGRAKKSMAKALKQGESQSALSTLSLPSASKMDNLEEEKKQLAEHPKENSTTTTSLASRIVIVDGKPVIERPTLDLDRADDFSRNKLVQMKKPDRLTSMSFKNRVHTEKWTPEENRKFYKSLEIFGSDFGLISKLFKNRTRNQIKNKFHKEEKQNSLKIDTSLKRHRKYNFKSMHEKINALNKAMITEYAKPPQTEEEPSYQTENRLEKFEKVDNISRNNSAASSVDSMDLSIMNEIQEIFNSEIDLIRNKKNATNIFLAPNPHPVLPLENGNGV